MGYLLLTWLGRADRSAAGHRDRDRPGPLAEVVARPPGDLAWEEVWILDDGNVDDYTQVEAWLGSHAAGLRLRRCPVDLSAMGGPMSYRALFGAARSHLDVPEARRRGRAYHLSSGTLAMAATFILLARTWGFAGLLVESSREKGVQQVDFPYDALAALDPRAAPLELPELDEPRTFGEAIYASSEMDSAVRQARQLAPLDCKILLLGETGTGKELFARGIHAESPRSADPFVAINCGAIPRELFEAELFGAVKGAGTGVTAREGAVKWAGAGTLFLDEIGELRLDHQVKILRLLECGDYQPVGGREARSRARILAATNRDLLSAVQDGTFREDLLYRLAEGVVHLPPLRERGADVELLAYTLVARLNDERKTRSLTPKRLECGAVDELLSRPWPGNVRELKATITRTVTQTCDGDLISADDIRRADELLRGRFRQVSGLKPIPPIGDGLDIRAWLNRQNGPQVAALLRDAWGRSGHNKSAAARLLGLRDNKTFDRWCADHGVDLA